MKLTDVHSHALSGDGIVNRGPADKILPGYCYSIGIHPWEEAGCSMESLTEAASRPEVIAIGETGLDKLRGPAMDIQIERMRQHIELSEQLHKPLIIHCVKSFDLLMALRREMRPKQVWIIHGFRGKPDTALQLAKAGMYLSLGRLFNTDTARLIPPDRLLIETDDSPVTIIQVAEAIAEARSCRPADIIELASSNLNRIFDRT